MDLLFLRKLICEYLFLTPEFFGCEGQSALLRLYLQLYITIIYFIHNAAAIFCALLLTESINFQDSKIGECKIPMKDYVEEKEQEEWFVLHKSVKSDKATGEVQIGFSMERVNK